MVTLRKGDRRSEVRRVQQILNLYVDGIFGILTEEAVKEFQWRSGLTPDGIVGAKTWAALEKLAALPAQPAQTQPAGVTLKRSKRNIDEIILHCSATHEGQHITTEDIKRMHLQRGFSGIGYHYVVYLDGTVHLGRDVDVSGAHCTGHNTHSIGVCYIGGLVRDPKSKQTKDSRTDKQKAGLLALLKTLRKLYPKARILGHRDTSPDRNGNGVIDPFERIKDCPCFDAIPEYKGI